MEKKLKEIKKKALDNDIVTRTFYQSLIKEYSLNTEDEFDEIEHESKKLERHKLVSTFVNLLHI